MVCCHIIMKVLIFFVILLSSSTALKVNWVQRKTPIYNGNNATELILLCPNGCGEDCPILDCDENAILSLRHAQSLIGGLLIAINESFWLPVFLKWVPLAVVFLLGSYLFYKKHFLWGSLIDEDIMGGTGGLYHRIYSSMKYEVVPIVPPEKYEKPVAVNPIIQEERLQIQEKVNEEGFGLGLLTEAYQSRQETMTNHAFNPMAWELEKLGEVRLQPMKLKKKPVKKKENEDTISDSIESNSKHFFDVVNVDHEGSDDDEYKILETLIEGEDTGYPDKQFVRTMTEMRIRADQIKRRVNRRLQQEHKIESYPSFNYGKISYSSSSSDSLSDN